MYDVSTSYTRFISARESKPQNEYESAYLLSYYSVFCVRMQLSFVRRAATWLCRPTSAARNVVLDVFQKLPPKNLGLTSHEVYERVLEYKSSSDLGPLPEWAHAPHEGHAVRSMRYGLYTTI